MNRPLACACVAVTDAPASRSAGPPKSQQRTDSETRIHVAPSTFLTSSSLPRAPIESSMARALDAELEASCPRYFAAAVASDRAVLALPATLPPASMTAAPAESSCAPSLGASGSAAPDAQEDAPAASAAVGSEGAGLVGAVASPWPSVYLSAAAVSSWAAVAAPAPAPSVVPSFPAAIPPLFGATSAEAPQP